MKKLSCLLATVLTLSFAVGGCGNSTTSQGNSSSKEPTKLVVSTWGYNEDKLKKNVIEPFEKANNCKIVLEVGNNDERLNKIQSMPGSVDVIYLADSYSMEGIQKGLFEKVDQAKIPNIKNIYPVAKSTIGDGYGPAYTINRTGIVYDTKTVTTPITSWSDLWRADLKGKVSVAEINSTAGPALMEVAANKAGVKLSSNTDGAFKEISDLKPNILKTYSKSSDFVNMFSQGEIAAGVAQDFVFAKIKEAVPTAQWADLKDGNYANLNTINIVKGSKNKELAEKFIDWCLSEQVQKANAVDKIDSPVNEKVTLTADQAKGLTYGKDIINNLKVIDWKQYNSAKAGIIDKWNAELSK